MAEREDIRAWRVAAEYARLLASNPLLAHAIIELTNGFYVTIIEGKVTVGCHPVRGSILRAEAVDLTLEQIPGYIAALEGDRDAALGESDTPSDEPRD